MVPDFTVAGACSSVTYTNTKPVTASFISNGNGAGKTFTWQTADSSLVGTYSLTVTATCDGKTSQLQFDL